MCSIAGFALLKGSKLQKPEVLKAMVNKILLSGQVRGTDATGVAINNGKNITVYKDNVKASLFIQQEEVKTMLDEHIKLSGDDRTTSIICHTRAKTTGSERFNINNHPIVTDSVVGIHNGSIYNHMALFNTYGLQRNGEVDSEIIFRLIEDYAKDITVEKAIYSATEKLDGSFACAMVKDGLPNKLFLFRKSNPTELVIFPNVGLLVFASTASMLKDCLDEHAEYIGRGKKLVYKEDTCIVMDLEKNQLIRHKIHPPKWNVDNYMWSGFGGFGV